MAEAGSALRLSWAYGVSTILHNVVNLSDEQSARIFYASSNTAVIQDVHEGTQTILQGHTQPIACVCSSDDTSLVATADRGPDSMLIVWNVITAKPQITIPKPHEGGCRDIDISGDGSLLISVSEPTSPGGVQEISLWDLTSSDPGQGVITIPIPAGDVQNVVRFNPFDTSEIISNGAQRVYFWRSCLPEAAVFKYYSPPLSSADFKAKIGAFTISTFVPGTTQAVTGTEDGDVVVWDEQGIQAEVGTRASDRKAVKLMRIHNSSISYLAPMGDFLVTGGAEGFVRFFDPMLRLIAWFENIQAGPIRSVSFSHAPLHLPAGDPADLDIFLCPDFVVGTSKNKVVALTADAFNGHDPNAARGALLLQGLVRPLQKVCAHPMAPLLLAMGTEGTVQLWDMVTHELLMTVDLKGESDEVPVSATYSRTGNLVIMGMSNGAVLILNAQDLSEITRMKQARTPIDFVAISAKAKHVAAASADGYIMLVLLVPYKDTMRWEYVGRTKAHYSPIVALHFGEAPSGGTRCFSLSEDGRLMEYDLEKSSLETGVVVNAALTVCGGAAPTAMSFTPPLSYYQQGVIDTQLILADSEYKIRLFNPDNVVTCGTYRGPVYGAPIAQMMTFQSAASDNTFVAFRADKRTAGVMAWPTDGHPDTMSGVVAHPEEIISAAVSYDGRKLITAAADGHINQWDIDVTVIEHALSRLRKQQSSWEHVVGDEIDINDVRRFFTFGQLRAQGEDTFHPRHIPGRLPLDHIPEMMSALGYYPTQAEITDMVSTVTYDAAIKEAPKPVDVDLNTFLYLYYNFKPVTAREVHAILKRHMQMLMEQIDKAFKTLGGTDPRNMLTAERLKEVITTLGEAMDVEELTEAMRLLTGKEALDEALPAQVTPQVFATDILGFEAVA